VGLTCSDTSNCTAGNICCIVSNGGNAPVTSSCLSATACAAANGGTGGGQLCDPNAAGGNTGCPDGGAGSCVVDTGNSNINSWGLPNSYATCGDIPIQ
jgi:hypothetical protein